MAVSGSTGAALAVAGLLALLFVVNELGHGAVAETVGLGHHHMLDYGGYHCAGHDTPDGARHMQHMHGNHTHAPCPGNHMAGTMTGAP